ncbi:hypothetical protein RBI13_21160 [Alcaligenaceae bacterium A4P071]|nr:hypothetical protein [Alcaligenaceae bacterium B3P038]MDQ2150945.1 hypothetical protein [Alcaligenaceae bacterium C4P045]MDQ2187697.1 hypothetical protein [Alcaligenaceae bacterium A4P071]
MPWHLLGALGDSKLLLPTALVTLACAEHHARPAVRRWLLALALAAGLVVLTKLAFMGWGLGLPALNFTGISGHAMLSAAIYPLLGYGLGMGYSPRVARYFLLGGFVLALLIAQSRVMTVAHSISESVVGFALGSLVAAYGWRQWPPAAGVRTPIALLSIGAIAVIFLALGSDYDVHQSIVDMAQKLSGEPETYRREHLVQPR